MNESISALLDGECSPQELDRLLADMERDPALREQFSRQVLARESRMGSRIRATRFDFSSQVLAALHDERSAEVVAFPSRVRTLPWKTLTGLAAAAAVGAMAVLVIKPQTGSAPAAVVATTSPSPAQGEVVAVSNEPVLPVATVSSDELTRQQLRNYLRAYSQAREQQHVRSMLGYARYSAYTHDTATAKPAGAETKR